MTLPADSLFQQAHQLLQHTPPDYAAALPLLQAAAAQGHAEAAFQLAGCCFYGQGTTADAAQAVRLLQQAADAGHVYARFNLLQLQENQGQPIANLLAAYQALADAGLLPAQIRLLEHHQQHNQAEQALFRAQQAATQNHPYAHYSLAQHHQYAPQPDLAAAHHHYQQAAAQGFAAAHWQLGNQYRYSQAVERNWLTAAQHFRHAAEAGLIPAQTALGQILLRGGHGLKADVPQALQWLQSAADKDDPDAHAELAEQYLTGQNTERHPQHARCHAEAAANHRHPHALRLLGDIYRYGLGVAADNAIAAAYYREAAEQGDLSAHQKLIAAEALKQSEHYQHIKQQALRRQQAEQAYQQAFACHYGLNTAQNYAEARRLYLQAAEQGHSKAQTNLGMMHYSGQGAAADPAEAVRWFDAAARQGDATAQYNLACLHYHGIGVAANPAEACRWLQSAIDHGHEQPETLRQLLQQWQPA